VVAQGAAPMISRLSRLRALEGLKSGSYDLIQRFFSRIAIPG